MRRCPRCHQGIPGSKPGDTRLRAKHLRLCNKCRRKEYRVRRDPVVLDSLADLPEAWERRR